MSSGSEFEEGFSESDISSSEEELGMEFLGLSPLLSSDSDDTESESEGSIISDFLSSEEEEEEEEESLSSPESPSAVVIPSQFPEQARFSEQSSEVPADLGGKEEATPITTPSGPAPMPLTTPLSESVKPSVAPSPFVMITPSPAPQSQTQSQPQIQPQPPSPVELIIVPQTSPPAPQVSVGPQPEPLEERTPPVPWTSLEIKEELTPDIPQPRVQPQVAGFEEIKIPLTIQGAERSEMEEMLARIEKTTVLKDPSREKKNLDELLTREEGEKEKVFEFRANYTKKAAASANILPTTAILLGQLATNRLLLGSTYDLKLTEALDFVDGYINKSL